MVPSPLYQCLRQYVDVGGFFIYRCEWMGWLVDPITQSIWHEGRELVIDLPYDEKDLRALIEEGYLELICEEDESILIKVSPL